MAKIKTEFLDMCSEYPGYVEADLKAHLGKVVRGKTVDLSQVKQIRDVVRGVEGERVQRSV